MPHKFDLHAFTRAATRDGRKLLAIYLTCGFPEREWTAPLAQVAFAAGADLLELGMPFSDPLADGPTIQAASQHSLERGVTSGSYFTTAREVAELGPTLFMGYLNSVTVPNFLNRARDAGLCGLILPEWPVHSAAFAMFERSAQNCGVPRIPFVAPTSSAERIAATDRLNAPFIYAVSIAGVTGARATVSERAYDYLAGLRTSLATPYLAGFGVANATAAQRMAAVADGVIVGSALLDGIGRVNTLEAACGFVRAFVSELRAALDDAPVLQENRKC
ncbi:MAG: tryptophan synthase subunit alpha [bacterium]|nr:tryptophan synthase subunit alpha [bacterium]